MDLSYIILVLILSFISTHAKTKFMSSDFLSLMNFCQQGWFILREIQGKFIWN